MDEAPTIAPVPDAERGMFGALLWSGEPQRQVLDAVPAVAFSGPGLAGLWRWAQEQPAESITPIGLAARASDAGYPQYGIAWLAETAQANPTFVLWTDIAAEVRRAHTMRLLRAAAAEVMAESQAAGTCPHELADRWANRLAEIGKGARGDGMHRLAELLPGVMDYLQRLHQGSADSAGVPTGYRALDEVSPLRPGELTLLAARPSLGKSALAVNMATNMARGTWPAAIVSLEMTAQALACRVLAGLAEANPKEAARGPDGTSAWHRVATAAVAHGNIPLTICQPGRLTVSGLRRLCRQCATQAGAKCIFVDYLQLVLPDSRSGNRNRENEVAEVSAAAKAIALDLGVPVVMLAQLNRQAEDGKPRLSHLRDSGSLEQDADAVWLLDRDRSDASGETVLTVAKNREGACGEQIRMIFRADCTLFVPADGMRFEQTAKRWT